MREIDGGIEHPRKFEVTLDSGADPLALAAIMGLARFSGVDVVDRSETLETPISDVDLQTISGDLWGDPTYGTFAASYIQNLRNDATQRVFYRNDGTANMYGRGDWQQFKLMGPGRYSPVSLKTGPEFDDHLATVFKESVLPFTMRPGRKSKTNEGTDFLEIKPDTLTNGRLALFMRYNRLHKHTLHGTLGKGLDVLLEAAGINRDPGVSREVDGPLVTKRELREIAAMAGLPGRMLQGIQEALRIGLETQLRNGVADERGEVMIEGDARMQLLRGMKWTTVAVSSVQESVRRRPRASKEVLDFLSRFTEHYTSYMASK